MFFKNHWLLGMFVFGGVVIMMYLLFYSTKTPQLSEKKQVSVSVDKRPVVKKDKYSKIKNFGQKYAEKNLEALYKLGDSASPSDIREIDFYERGGIIAASAEIMELPKSAVESIRKTYHQMETQGYYNVEVVDDLSINAGLVQKLKGFFKASGASNYHDGLQSVNEHLSFSSTDLDISFVC